MKKPLFKLLLFCGLLVGCQKGFSQQTTDPGSILGHFEVTNVTGGITNHTNVNYRLFPAPVVDTLNVDLNTPGTMYMAIDVLDASNVVLLTWSPTSANNSYLQAFDVSGFGAGTYHVNIKDSSSVLNTIVFTKP